MFITAILFIAILAVLIFVHELGHFVAAKLFKIRVDEFALGFPPRIFSWKPRTSETRYALNAIPFGGYVKIFGENPDEASLTGPGSERSFVNQARWKQALVLLAGVTFNALFAWLILSIGFMYGLPSSVSTDELPYAKNVGVSFVSVMPGSPAEHAGIKMGDRIIFAESSAGAVRAEEMDPSKVQELIRAGAPVTFILERPSLPEPTGALTAASKRITVTVEPIVGLVGDKKAIGVAMDMVGTVQYPVHLAFVRGGQATWGLVESTAGGLYGFLKRVVVGQAHSSEVSGPIGIAGMVGEARQLGLAYLITFTALISINLAVLNLLPIPALDGGRLLFVAIEAVKRSRLSPKWTNRVNIIGFILLMGLMVIVTIKDIVGLFTK